MFMMSSTERGWRRETRIHCSRRPFDWNIIVDLAGLTSCKAVLESLRAQQHFPKSRAGHMTSRRKAI